MGIKIEMWKKPKGVTIVEGFPGFGLVGPITTEFLIDHLKTEQIGQFVYDDLPATIAIHKGEIVNPMAVHYSKKYNLVICHTILNVKGKEWEIAGEIMKLVTDLKAKEVLSLEGVNVMTPPEEATPIYSFGNKKLEELGAKPMNESIIMGVSAALLLRNKMTSCIFAQAASTFPDSKAAAEMIKFLDKYLSLHVDPAPLLKQAEEFEAKIKTIFQQSQSVSEEADKKNLSYLG